MLTLPKRPAKIGPSLNPRRQKHGEENVPACDIPIVGIMLDAQELNALLGDPYAHRALFNTRREGELPEPMFRQFKPFRLRDKFEEAEITIYLGMHGREISLSDVTLARVELDPQVGGLTAMSILVQGTPDGDSLAELYGYMDHDCDVEITFGKKVEKKSDRQSELPLNSFGDGERPDNYDRRSTITNPVTGEEMRARTQAKSGAPVDDTAEFEEAARKQVEAFNARPGHVIDGTTPKSRRRRRNQAAAH